MTHMAAILDRMGEGLAAVELGESALNLAESHLPEGSPIAVEAAHRLSLLYARRDDVAPQPS